MSQGNKIWDLTESQDMELATVKVSITPETQKRKKSQKSDLGDIEKVFWQEWSAIQYQLYRCCLKLMNFNPTNAEDALSRAMLHCWEKAQNIVGKIGNLKGWLMQVTRNFCYDIIRQESREAVGVEDIEWVWDTGDMGLLSSVESPEMVLERDERSQEIRRAVDGLPDKTRDTFILHYYEELSHNEIVERQGISYDRVCKRISQARKKLQRMLRGYFLISEVEGGNMSQSPPKMEERRLRRSQEVLKGNEIPKVRWETEEVFVDGVEKPEMVEGPVESRKGVEVKILDGVSVSAEADVDVAECSESVELAGEDISDVAGVGGVKELLPILPGVLYPLSHELTMRRDELSFAPLPEWGQEMLAAFFIGEVMEPEMSLGHKGEEGFWWRKYVGRLSSIIDVVGVVIRKFFNVPVSSKSLTRFWVKANLRGECQLYEYRVGVLGSKHRRPPKMPMQNAGDFDNSCRMVFDTG